MSQDIAHFFHDIPVHENSKNLFEKLLSTREDRIIVSKKLLDFYLTEQYGSVPDFNTQQDFLNAIQLLLVSFAYIVVVKEEEYFQQFCRRFIFESKEDSQEVFSLKKFFISHFDSTEEYHIQYINSHQDIKKRTDTLLLKYIQFFHDFL